MNTLEIIGTAGAILFVVCAYIHLRSRTKVPSLHVVGLSGLAILATVPSSAQKGTWPWVAVATIFGTVTLYHWGRRAFKRI